ncbi:MAG: prepilin-type N-terminal cleavage/methylation domain-containing protein [Candidatus Tectomicrobia bacterium]|uniref:Prepilin-type N-terminal cleavage/methylation domain-containing protein n=1 Tax=Tectimicrobiota bacterium TaxID=2528274 RepID=A0A932FXE8_UNCTE|nr:prepilin-type N-terminal cleavage/methylation domain-containing protein [Candidatus Tectomicrobia bacterium]
MVHPKAHQAGFTMIELLIALVLASLVIGAAFNVFISQEKVYAVQDQVLELEQNLRAGMDLLVREIRMAGFGQPSWTTINTSTGINYTIQVTDGGSSPDTLNLVGCIEEPKGTLASAAGVGNTTLTLQSSSEASKLNTTTKRDIFIGDLENAKVTGISGATLTIDTDPDVSGNQGLLNAYPASTSSNPMNVYLVRRITYTVDTDDNELARNENTGAGSQPMASNIVDLQLVQSGSFVTITLTGRTSREDPDYTDPTYGDGYRRRSLTIGIRLRNG